jgi:hypothetical protein
MLHSIEKLQGFNIQATDGAIGEAHQFLFDDQHWTVRYVVVDTGGWLSGRRVLISPIAVRGVHPQAQMIAVELTRHQVEHSPSVLTDQPVSRQQEAALAQYYNYQPYWTGTSVWGMGLYPIGLAAPALHTAVRPPSPATNTASTPAVKDQPPPGDRHLRSTREVIGYDIQASDGAIGHVEDFLVDTESWMLRYMIVDTKNWWPGKKVLVAPAWIDTIAWATRDVRIAMSRQKIKEAPPYDPAQPVDQAYKERIRAYYNT